MLSKTTAGLTHGEGVSKYTAYNMQRRWTERIDTHIDDDEERNILRNTKIMRCEIKCKHPEILTWLQYNWVCTQAEHKKP